MKFLNRKKGGFWLSSLAGLVVVMLLGGLLTSCSGGSGWSGSVLLVGTYHGKKGQYATIQTAVNAAKPGDWILVAPGDYHPRADFASKITKTKASLGDFGAVLITKKTIHLVGMSRNSVIVDGTKKGAPKACDTTAKWQTLGAIGPTGKPLGRNGVMVFEADNVWVDNLTACNFLGGSGSAGNGVWWDGGSGTGKIGLKGYWGSYLTATSTYLAPKTNVHLGAEYGIFANSAAGPAGWTNIYASNMNDSGSYVGACQQVCTVTIKDAWMEYNALGYSGTNSGGQVVVETSQFDNNQDGFDTNTQIAGDPPPPQNGDCPDGKTSSITHTRSCWVFIHNYVHNNNNPHVPATGSASNGPTGTGMTLSGGRNDTVMDNRFWTNGAWGNLVVPYPDSTKPPPGVTCKNSGGVETTVLGLGCIYDPENDEILDNTYKNDGFFGNQTAADIGRVTLNPGQPSNCFIGNKDPQGTATKTLEKTTAVCGQTSKKQELGGNLIFTVLCDTGFEPSACTSPNKFPQRDTTVVLHPLPTKKKLSTMPNPCSGAPSNMWCTGGKPIS